MSLRSDEWFKRRDEMGLRHRSVLSTLGYDPRQSAGKPIIGICNPASELNNCELGLDELAPIVKRGVIESGGIPLEFGTMPLGAELLKPSDLLYRNLVSMEIEETVRAYPIDGLVLLCGCDKTTPAQLMAAASCDIPSIQLSAGPKAAGTWRGEPVSSGTDLWRHWDDYRSGKLTDDEWEQLEHCISCSYGACNEMGSSSTMTAMSEVLGMMPAGTSTLPANDTRRRIAAENCGRRIVDQVREDLRPSDLLTRDAFENAIRVLHAIGGSTNAVLHLVAIAGRRGIHLPLSLFDELALTTPVLVNLKPSGKYLLEDLHRAGGVPAVMKEIEAQLNTDCRTVTGGALAESLASAACFNREVIKSADDPIQATGALVILTGNRAPAGAVLKVSAADENLLEHTGPALVFENYEEMLAGMDRDDLDVTPDTVLLMRNTGPRGAPGMPEWGSLPIPRKLLQAGVRDVVRISDARMSGTSYGTVVLHVAPESAAGGPLAIVQTGDRIRLSVNERKLELMLPEDEIERRLAQWTPPATTHFRGYMRLFIDHVLQADRGCDLDFLCPDSEAALPFVQPQVGRS
jgi:dihydroxy-acid dehydratase